MRKKTLIKLNLWITTNNKCLVCLYMYVLHGCYTRSLAFCMVIHVWILTCLHALFSICMCLLGIHEQMSEREIESKKTTKKNVSLKIFRRAEQFSAVFRCVRCAHCTNTAKRYFKCDESER